MSVTTGTSPEGVVMCRAATRDDAAPPGLYPGCPEGADGAADALRT